MSTEDQSLAVENTILNLLTTSKKHFEFPDLQNEATDSISTNLSNIIYDTLKQKSLASSSKRSNVLKFLNNISSTNEFHHDKNFYKIYLDCYMENLQIKHFETECFIQDCNEELYDIELYDFYHNIKKFYEQRDAKRKTKISKQELIKQKDQENVNKVFNMQVSRGFGYYEMSERIINELLQGSDLNQTKLVTDINNSRAYRKKQIRFCYALINLNMRENYEILKYSMERMLKYKNLEIFETEYLTDLWALEDKHTEEFINFLVKDFFFILEKHIINFCVELIVCKGYSQFVQHFNGLKTNKMICTIRTICHRNPLILYKIRNFIQEMYVYSYCNKNILQFLELFS